MSSSTASTGPTVLLNSGAQMPILGLGTYKLRSQEEVDTAVDAALASGYRSFDSAAVYQNEAELGKALRELMPKYGLTRADVFVTSKLDPKEHGEKAREAILHSLDLLQLDYIDLLLIHWPGSRGMPVQDARNTGNRAESWVVLEQLYNEGKLKSIGVSNYSTRHMRELMKECKVTPALLQVEFHPRLCQKELRSLCEELGVCFQAYSSLGKGELPSDPVITEIANQYGRSSAQILLRWAVQQGVPVLPKSSNPERIKGNAAIFDFTLSDADMDRLSSLDSGQRFCWDPSEVA